MENSAIVFLIGLALGFVFGGLMTILVSVMMAASRASKLEEEFYARNK